MNPQRWALTLLQSIAAQAVQLQEYVGSLDGDMIEEIEDADMALLSIFDRVAEEEDE